MKYVICGKLENGIRKYLAKKGMGISVKHQKFTSHPSLFRIFENRYKAYKTLKNLHIEGITLKVHSIK